MKLLILVFAAILLGGCCGMISEREVGPIQPLPSETSGTSPTEEPQAPPPVSGGEGTIIEVPSGTGSGIIATSQEDCATLTRDCKSCLAKSGCGWCKATNSCLFGTASGPSVSSCAPDKWTVTESGCSIVADENDCSKITNCADCLSGSGCKWCIQGSLCAGESSSATCFGNWLTESYQCNFASR